MNAVQNPINTCPYWVGDILVTMSAITPAQRWAGTTWEQITDCMLRSADDTHPAGSTGGAWEVVQTVEQVARHTHIQYAQTSDGNINPVINSSASGGYSGAYSTYNWLGGGNHAAISTLEAGDSQPMPIVNKYIACYMWQRTG